MAEGDVKQWLPGFIALGVAWGSSFLFIKWGLLTLTPLGVAFGRSFIGAVTLVLYALVTKSALPRNVRDWGHLAVLAVLLNALPGYLFANGETHVSSVMAGLLNATTPLMTVIVIGFAFREQRVTRNQLLGVGVGFVGIVLVTGALGGARGSDWRGSVPLLLATLSYGASFPYSKRFVSTMNYSASALAATQITCSTLLLAPFVFMLPPTHAQWNPKALLGMVILGSVGTGFAYIWNFRNIRVAGSAVASTVTYITPVVATALGIAFLREPFQLRQLVGGALVLASAGLVQGRLRVLR